jgi:7-cyano-7-deazaguanine synthase
MSVGEKKAVMVLSWWIDSTTLLYRLVNEWYEVYPIWFIYWQNHTKELDFAKQTCEKLWLDFKIVDLSFLKDLLKSGLMNWEISDDLKTLVVPNRNMIFISIAVWYAESIWAEIVWYWIYSWWEEEHQPDCREEFVNKLNDVVKISDWNYVELYMPYLKYSKDEIIKEWIKNWVDYSLTRSCYKWGETPCGECVVCRERENAFQKNWIKDPLLNNKN